MVAAAARQEAEGIELVEKATVAITLKFSMPTASARIEKDNVETDADPARVAATKKLLAGSAGFRRLKGARGAMKKWLDSVSLSEIAPGRDLVALASVEAIEARLGQFVADTWQPALDAFVEEYPEIKEQAKLPKEQGGLGSLYRERDYPPADEVRAKCRVSWGYESPPGAPATLRQVSAEFFREQREKAVTEWKDATQDITQALRVGMLELVERMAKALGTRADGRNNVLRDSLFEEFDTFLGMLDSRNVVGDQEVERIAARARSLLAGKGIEELRKDEAVRDRVAVGMQEIAKKLEAGVVVRRRKISFGDEE